MNRSQIANSFLVSTMTWYGTCVSSDAVDLVFEMMRDLLGQRERNLDGGDIDGEGWGVVTLWIFC